MQQGEHSVVREGLVVGLLGAVLVALWYFVVDAIGGRPFHTFNVLGGVFFRGEHPGILTGILLAPELPLEEFFFLALLCYTTMNTYCWVSSRRGRRVETGRER